MLAILPGLRFVILSAMQQSQKMITLFENVNGINIPKNAIVNGNHPCFFRFEKPEQIDTVILTVESHNIRKDSITIRSSGGKKRQRTTIQLLTINISLLFEGTSLNISFSFTDGRSVKETLDDLYVVDLWRKGNALIFSEMVDGNMVTIYRLPPIEESAILETLSNFVDKNREIYSQLLKLEKYLKTEFLLPKNLTYADKYAITKILSAFEPVEVEGTHWKLDLQLNCDKQLFDTLKTPSSSLIRVTEQIEEIIHLLGHEYIIREQQFTILSPVIANTDEVRNELLSRNKAIAKIVSSAGKLVLQCKIEQK